MDLRPVDPLGVPVEHGRPLAQRAEDAVADGEVVLREVELGHPGLGEVDLLGRGDPHAFTLLHESEREAFEAQVASLGVGTTLFVDTYDVTEGVRTAVEVAGTSLGGVRLDSGDLVVQASEVREQLDALGATETKIVVTSDLDEYAIAALAAAPVDTYGVGTRVVTGSGHPTASMVYKLVAREDDEGRMIGVAKKSKDKQSVGGRKYALRRRNPLGREHAGLEGARARHEASVAELPRSAHQLSQGQPAVETVFLTETP